MEQAYGQCRGTGSGLNSCSDICCFFSYHLVDCFILACPLIPLFLMAGFTYLTGITSQATFSYLQRICKGWHGQLILHLLLAQEVKFPLNATGVSHQSQGLEFATAFCNAVKGPQPLQILKALMQWISFLIKWHTAQNMWELVVLSESLHGKGYPSNSSTCLRICLSTPLPCLPARGCGRPNVLITGFPLGIRKNGIFFALASPSSST